MRPFFSPIALTLACALAGNAQAQSHPASAPASVPATTQVAPMPVQAPLFAIYLVKDDSKQTVAWNPLSTHAKEDGPLGIVPQPLLTEKDVASVEAQRNVAAQRNPDGTSRIHVFILLLFRWTPQGDQRLAAFSAAHIHQRLALVYQNQVISAPYIAKKLQGDFVPLLEDYIMNTPNLKQNGYKLEDGKVIASAINAAATASRPPQK